jgi:hypothetical protein
MLKFVNCHYRSQIDHEIRKRQKVEQEKDAVVSKVQPQRFKSICFIFILLFHFNKTINLNFTSIDGFSVAGSVG